MKSNPTNLLHPCYLANLSSWQKYRICYAGGETFIDNYLVQWARREDYNDFKCRRKVTYAPTHSAAAIKKIRDDITSKLHAVTRKSDSTSYMKASNQGLLNHFIATDVLNDLLPIGKVGIYIDRADIGGMNINEISQLTPYLYCYRAEDIRAWAYDDNGKLSSVILRDHVDKIDKETGVMIGEEAEFRLIQKTDNGITVSIYQDNKTKPKSITTLNLPEIPFVILELPCALMQDIADIQIALLNMASSDTAFTIYQNFNIYTEQFDGMLENNFLKPSGTEDGEVDNVKGRTETANLGTARGRRYPRNTERPGFISPDPDPLRVSMEKQEALVKEINRLLHQTLLEFTTYPTKEGLAELTYQQSNASMCYIAMVLQKGEQAIAQHWQAYEKLKSEIVIEYPTNFISTPFTKILDESKRLNELAMEVPSETYRKIVKQIIAKSTVGTNVTSSDLDKINNEIDDAIVVNVNPDNIRSDYDSGLISTETAVKALLYPKDEAERAKQDKAERLAMTALAQSSVNNSAARGLSTDGNANLEKTMSQDPLLNGTQATRGAGK